MIDYISVSSSMRANICSNEVSIKGSVIKNNALTGEQKISTYYKYRSLTVITIKKFDPISGITKFRTEIKGSLHKWYHSDNAGNFTFKEVSESIGEICTSIGVPSHHFEFHGIEFAINASLFRDIREILSTNFITHRKASSEPHRDDYRHRGYMLRIPGSYREFKLYDKGKESLKAGNILRVEYRAKQASKITWINSLSDLLKSDVWNTMYKQLIDIVKNMIIVDDPDLSNPICNAAYWSSLKVNNRHRHKYAFITLTYSRLKRKSLIQCTNHIWR